MLCSNNTIVSSRTGRAMRSLYQHVYAVCLLLAENNETGICELPAVACCATVRSQKYFCYDSGRFDSVCVAPSTKQHQPSGSAPIIPYPPLDTALSQFHPPVIITSDFLTTRLMLSSHRYPRFSLGLLTDRLCSGPLTKIMYAFLFCPVSSACPARPILTFSNTSLNT